MEPGRFRTADGRPVPAVTAEEMAAVDRAAEGIGLTLLMMMEHAGRGLAETVQERVPEGRVAVLAGGGGNGGGGLCAARHLANHGRGVDVVLDRDPAALDGAPARQWRVLGDAAADRSDSPGAAIEEASVVVDALVGYRLRGAPRGRLAELVEGTARAETAISLDVPTGVDATTGARPGGAVSPDVTLTLALPKAGLVGVEGDLLLADIGLPRRVFVAAGVDYRSPFDGRWRVPLEAARG